MLKSIVLGLALAVLALFKPISAQASGSCLFDAHMNISSPYTVEWEGTPNNNTFIPPINGQNGDFFGVGLISTGTDCAHLSTGGSFTIMIPNNWIGNNPSPLTAGTITISCFVYHADGTTSIVTSVPVNLVIDPYCTQCTFRFYVAACDGAGACTLGVCKSCLAPAGQQ